MAVFALVVSRRGLPSVGWLSRPEAEERPPWRDTSRGGRPSALARPASARPKTRVPRGLASGEGFAGVALTQGDRRLVELCKRLVAATTAGYVEWAPWERTTFACSRRSATLLISSSDRCDRPSYEFAVYNSDGVLADRLSCEWSHETAAFWNETLASLYMAARHKALGVDRLIDDLLREVSPPPATSDRSGDQHERPMRTDCP
jgi:hypothetical protein